MNLSKEDIRKLQKLILFTAILVVVLINYKVVINGIKVGIRMVYPFILGGAMAFIINAPMQFFERNLFKKRTYKNKKIAKKLARPCSLILSLICIIGILAIVIFIVFPELANTFSSLSMNISMFIPKARIWIVNLFQNNPEIVKMVYGLQFDWDKLIETGINFFSSGAGDVLSSTFAVAKSVVSALTNFVIGFVFACYILLQKEKLTVQAKKIAYALLPEKKVTYMLRVCSMAYRIFLNFLTGQCVEAVILGTMFFITMSIFRFPYALLVGVLIAFTALIPIFGAFIGCVVGAFLIFMVDPLQALLFIVMFLILQQIEGNLIYPHVVGGSVGLPSIWVLMAVTLGASLMGIVGMLIFIPITSVVYTLFREFIYAKLKIKGIEIKE